MFPIRDHNPSGRTAFVTYVLIAINALVFLAFFPTKSEFQLGYVIFEWGLVPAQIMAGEGYQTYVTSMFLHGG